MESSVPGPDHENVNGNNIYEKASEVDGGGGDVQMQVNVNVNNANLNERKSYAQVLASKKLSSNSMYHDAVEDNNRVNNDEASKSPSEESYVTAEEDGGSDEDLTETEEQQDEEEILVNASLIVNLNESSILSYSNHTNNVSMSSLPPTTPSAEIQEKKDFFESNLIPAKYHHRNQNQEQNMQDSSDSPNGNSNITNNENGLSTSTSTNEGESDNSSNKTPTSASAPIASMSMSTSKSFQKSSDDGYNSTPNASSISISFSSPESQPHLSFHQSNSKEATAYSTPLQTSHTEVVTNITTPDDSFESTDGEDEEEEEDNTEEEFVGEEIVTPNTSRTTAGGGEILVLPRNNDNDGEIDKNYESNKSLHPADEGFSEIAEKIFELPQTVSELEEISIYANSQGQFVYENPSNDESIRCIGKKKVYIIGTAHFSKESQMDVEKTIRHLNPGMVILELCSQRKNLLTYDEDHILAEASKLDFNTMRVAIKQNGLMQGLLNVFLLSMSAQLTKQLGMAPGGEFRCAMKEAVKLGNGCVVVLGDRGLTVTLKRALDSLSTWQRVKLGVQFCWSGVWAEKITKEEVEKCKDKDLIESMMADLTGEYPGITRVFVHERDYFMAHFFRINSTHYLQNELNDHFKSCEDSYQRHEILNRPVVAVVGMGHVSGITKLWGQTNEKEFQLVCKMPEESLKSKIIKKTIKLGFYGLIGFGIYRFIGKRFLK